MGGGAGDTACRQVSHLLAGCWDYTRAMEFNQSWGWGPVSLLVLRWEVKGQEICPRLRSCRLGQLSVYSSHPPFLPTGLGCTCASGFALPPGLSCVCV